MNEEKHIPAGYKPSLLGPIPEDWEVRRLGEIGEVLMCKRIMKYQTDSCGDIPFFKIGTFGGKPDAYISREVFDEYKAKYSYPKVGDVLISAAGTIGRSVIFDGTPSYYQDSNIVWIDNDNKQLLNKYLYYYYSTINWITDTGTIPRLYNGTLKAIQIPTPPIDQQKRIVSILELWDTAIEKQTALIEKLSLRKRGLMQQLLTGKKRLKGFSGEWKEVRLGEMAMLVGGGTPTTKNTNYWNGNILWISSSDLKEDDLRISGTRFITEEAIVNSTTQLLPTKSILIVTRVGIGKVAIAEQPTCVSQDFTCLIKYDAETNFLAYYLLQLMKKKKNQSQGTSIKGISVDEISKIRIYLPTKIEQVAIASVLVNADKEIEIQKQKLAAIQTQKKGLMQVLLTGKRRIKIN